jgi:hypothetical protein
MLHRNRGRKDRVVLDVIDTLIAYTATPQGLVTAGMAFLVMVMVRRGGNRGGSRHTD